MEQHQDDGKTVMIELKQDAVQDKQQQEEDATLTHSSIYPVHKKPHGINLYLVAGILVIILVVAVFLLLSGIAGNSKPAESDTSEPASQTTPTETDPDPSVPGKLHVTGLTEAAGVSSAVNSDFVLVADAQTLRAKSAKNANERMYPASLTKIMTFLVAYDKIPDRTKQLTLTKDIKNLYSDASRIGIDVGDILTVEQCMYAMLLESDTDSVLLLVREAAGSETEFARLMNEKAADLGLASTHFENATGLHDADHYTTPAEMAVIFAEALKNDLFHTIITAEKYVTYLGYLNNGVNATYRITFFNGTLIGRFQKNGLSVKLSNGITVLGGKTGFTDEAAYCQAALASDANGNEYIAILGHAKTAKQSALDTCRVFTDALN